MGCLQVGGFEEEQRATHLIFRKDIFLLFYGRGIEVIVYISRIETIHNIFKTTRLHLLILLNFGIGGIFSLEPQTKNKGVRHAMASRDC